MNQGPYLINHNQVLRQFMSLPQHRSKPKSPKQFLRRGLSSYFIMDLKTCRARDV
jgi:hypothetical protein